MENEREQILDYLDKLTLLETDSLRFEKALDWIEKHIMEWFYPELKHDCISLVAINALKFGKVYEVEI